MNKAHIELEEGKHLVVLPLFDTTYIIIIKKDLDCLVLLLCCKLRPNNTSTDSSPKVRYFGCGKWVKETSFH